MNQNVRGSLDDRLASKRLNTYQLLEEKNIIHNNSQMQFDEVNRQYFNNPADFQSYPKSKNFARPEF